MFKKLLWPYEVAREVGISARTVNRLADAGAVSVWRDIKGRRRFRPDAIDTLRKVLERFSVACRAHVTGKRELPHGIRGRSSSSVRKSL
jgi:hypothetical protein